MTCFLSNAFKLAGRQVQNWLGFRQFHALPTTLSTGSAYEFPTSNPWSITAFRTIIRNRFPRAKEQKRVKTLGWKARLSTKNGRRTIMRRILKGRFYLTH